MTGVWVENIWIPPFAVDAIGAVQAAFDLLEAGQIDHLLPDPFYKRAEGRAPLTDDEVDAVIAAIDAEYDLEMKQYASHHLHRSGATDRTELHRLPPLARRALAEQLDLLIDQHEDIDQSPVKVERSEEGVAY